MGKRADGGDLGADVYDGLNRRIARHDDAAGKSTYFAFLRGGETLGEYRRTGDLQNPWQSVREYVWLEGRPVAQEEHPSATERHTYFVHVDHIGLPRAMTNSNGQVVWQASARPYGDVEEVSFTDPVSGRTLVTNLRLPGQYDERLLASVGLQGPYYNWNRWYLPSVGRYLELDPIAKAGGFNGFYGPNWYGYAEGNPVRITDPLGLAGQPEPPWHPGKTSRCTMLDSCEMLKEKMEQFKRMIDTHTNWDRNVCKPNGGNRHAKEIGDLWGGYASCQFLYEAKCGQSDPFPILVPDPFKSPYPGYPRNMTPNTPIPAATLGVGGMILAILGLVLVG
jgi:RHS repeat-associated protein